MIVGIISSLIAAVIAGIVVATRRSEWFRETMNTGLLVLAPLTLRRPQRAVSSVRNFRKIIVRTLLHDQSTFGPHRGQFGKSTSLSETKKWQTVGSRENVSVKPRMYLTYWPALILNRHHLANRSVTFALLAVRRLFSDNRILIAQSASPDMAPNRNPILVSYRHTMAGALILAEFDAWNPITRGVVDAMLDSNNRWQENSGGWRQVNEDFDTTDLWASAYAAKLLLRSLSPNAPFSPEERAIADERLNSTIRFFDQEWTSKNWAFGKLSTEEAAPLLFIDLVEVLRARHQELLRGCIERLRSWLSPGGDISETYRQKLEIIPLEQLHARMAYAFFVGDRQSGTWRKLFERLSTRSLRNLLSSDLAFVLDMNCAFGD